MAGRRRSIVSDVRIHRKIDIFTALTDALHVPQVGSLVASLSGKNSPDALRELFEFSKTSGYRDAILDGKETPAAVHLFVV